MNLKEKTIVIDNKTYRYCKIVMLATTETIHTKSFSVKLILNNFGKLQWGNPVGKSESAQRLYFLSTDKICEGDWYYNEFGNNNLEKAETIYEVNDLQNCYKVIASTNQILNLPKPSEQFLQIYIDAYNKGEKIEECLVEYININNYSDINRLEDFEYFIPKVTKGEITTRKIKDNFTLEELENALVAHYLDIGSTKGCNLGEDVRIWTKKWIEQNL